MSMPARNDPCPCGSGKKYKKCHGAASPAAGDAVYERLRRLEGEATECLLKFAKRRYGKSCLDVAREQFGDPERVSYSRDDPEEMYFLRWFEYNWRPEGKETLAGAFLADRSSKNIDPGIRRVIETTNSAPYSFYQAQAVEPGIGITLRDVLRNHEVSVTERTASFQLEKGNIMLARVVEVDGISFIMGNGTQPLRAAFLRDLQDVRVDLEDAGLLDIEPDGTNILLDSEEFLREVYFKLAEAQEKSLTDIRNIDGDPLVLHTLRYTIPEFEAPFHALKALEQRASGVSDNDMLAGDERDKDGTPVRGRIHWLKKRRKGDEGFSTLATFTFTDTAMTVEVNSERRSRIVQKEIAKRLGELATLMHIDVTPAAGVMKDALRNPKEHTRKPDAESDEIDVQSPEIRHALKNMLDRHWDAWPDTPVPALRGMTPRQAAKDRLGRELLESLLLEFEVISNKETDEFKKVDVDALRRKLGLRR